MITLHILQDTKIVIGLLYYLSVDSVKKSSHIVYNVISVLTLYSMECRYFMRFCQESYCWEHAVPLVLRDTLCTVKLLRVLVDVLWQKVVLVLMTNENILSVCTAVKENQNTHHHRGKDIKLWLSSAILYLFHRYKPHKLP